MKNREALKQAKGWLVILSVVVPCTWAAYIWTWDWMLAAIAGFMTLFLAHDVRTFARIKSATRKDPGFLDEDVSGA